MLGDKAIESLKLYIYPNDEEIEEIKKLQDAYKDYHNLLDELMENED